MIFDHMSANSELTNNLVTMSSTNTIITGLTNHCDKVEITNWVCSLCVIFSQKNKKSENLRLAVNDLAAD